MGKEFPHSMGKRNGYMFPGTILYPFFKKMKILNLYFRYVRLFVGQLALSKQPNATPRLQLKDLGLKTLLMS